MAHILNSLLNNIHEVEINFYSKEQTKNIKRIGTMNLTGPSFYSALLSSQVQQGSCYGRTCVEENKVKLKQFNTSPAFEISYVFNIFGVFNIFDLKILNTTKYLTSSYFTLRGCTRVS